MKSSILFLLFIPLFFTLEARANIRSDLQSIEGLYLGHFLLQEPLLSDDPENADWTVFWKDRNSKVLSSQLGPRKCVILSENVSHPSARFSNPIEFLGSSASSETIHFFTKKLLSDESRLTTSLQKSKISSYLMEGLYNTDRSYLIHEILDSPLGDRFFVHLLTDHMDCLIQSKKEFVFLEYAQKFSVALKLTKYSGSIFELLLKRGIDRSYNDMDQGTAFIRSVIREYQLFNHTRLSSTPSINSILNRILNASEVSGKNKKKHRAILKQVSSSIRAVALPLQSPFASSLPLKKRILFEGGLSDSRPFERRFAKKKKTLDSMSLPLALPTSDLASTQASQQEKKSAPLVPKKSYKRLMSLLDETEQFTSRFAANDSTAIADSRSRKKTDRYEPLLSDLDTNEAQGKAAVTLPPKKRAKKHSYAASASSQQSQALSPYVGYPENFPDDLKSQLPKVSVQESRFLRHLGISHENGLYADVFIPEGTILAWYTGKSYNRAGKFHAVAKRESHLPKRAEYALDVITPNDTGRPSFRFTIDAFRAVPAPMSPAAFMNHTVLSEANAYFDAELEKGRMVPIVAKKDIFPHQEILIHYGSSYDQQLQEDFPSYRAYIQTLNKKDNGVGNTLISSSNLGIASGFSHLASGADAASPRKRLNLSTDGFISVDQNDLPSSKPDSSSRKSVETPREMSPDQLFLEGVSFSKQSESKLYPFEQAKLLEEAIRAYRKVLAHPHATQEKLSETYLSLGIAYWNHFVSLEEGYLTLGLLDLEGKKDVLIEEQIDLEQCLGFYKKLVRINPEYKTSVQDIERAQERVLKHIELLANQPEEAQKSDHARAYSEAFELKAKADEMINTDRETAINKYTKAKQLSFEYASLDASTARLLGDTYFALAECHNDEQKKKNSVASLYYNRCLDIYQNLYATASGEDKAQLEVEINQVKEELTRLPLSIQLKVIFENKTVVRSVTHASMLESNHEDREIN